MSHTISSTTNMGKTFPNDMCQQALGILHHWSYDGNIYGVTSKCCNDLERITFKDNILKTHFHRQYCTCSCSQSLYLWHREN
ncbi:unnamed protein product, partial [Prunus brigantina]